MEQFPIIAILDKHTFMEGKLLTKKEAADFMRVSLRTFSSYVKNGLIPAYKIGRKMLIKESDLPRSLKIVKTVNDGR